MHGNKTLIAKELDKYPEIKNKCKIKHCDKVVQMEDKPSQSIRGGKNSSMWNTIEKKKSKAEAAISCRRALDGISTLILRRLPNVKRPAIAILAFNF